LTNTLNKNCETRNSAGQSLIIFTIVYNIIKLDLNKHRVKLRGKTIKNDVTIAAGMQRTGGSWASSQDYVLTVRAVGQRGKILYCMCEQSPVGQLAKNVYPDRVNIVRAIAVCLVGVSKTRGVFERGGGWASGNTYRRYSIGR
jgi:hypothetical protein